MLLCTHISFQQQITYNRREYDIKKSRRSIYKQHFTYRFLYLCFLTKRQCRLPNISPQFYKLQLLVFFKFFLTLHTLLHCIYRNNFTQSTTFKDSSTKPLYISKMEQEVNLLQVKKCNVLFTKMKSFKIASCLLYFMQSVEGREMKREAVVGVWDGK